MSELDDHLSDSLSLELTRTLSLKMQEAGIPTAQICEVLSVSCQYVSKWKKKYAGGGLPALRVAHEGRAPYLNKEVRAEVISHISAQTHYSLAELVNYIEEKHGVVFKSQQSYYELLSEGGLSWHKTQKANPKRDSEAVVKKREELKKNWIRKRKKSKKEKSLS